VNKILRKESSLAGCPTRCIVEGEVGIQKGHATLGYEVGGIGGGTGNVNDEEQNSGFRGGRSTT